MKNLIIMRHGEAENSFTGDKDRALTQRGHEQVELSGEFISANLSVPDYVLVSSALRTRETVDGVQTKLKLPDDKLVFEDDLYLASVDTLIETVKSLTCDTLMIIGHNPGLHELVLYLSKELAHGFRGMGVACVVNLHRDDAADDLRPGSLAMDGFYCPP